MATQASRVHLSYPADLSDWGRDLVEGHPFRAYLRKAHERATVGDVWAEFVGVGCCGDSLDVPLAVEGIETDDESGDNVDEALVGPDTAFVFEVREACDLDGGWQVQSAAGP